VRGLEISPGIGQRLDFSVISSGSTVRFIATTFALGKERSRMNRRSSFWIFRLSSRLVAETTLAVTDGIGTMPPMFYAVSMRRSPF